MLGPNFSRIARGGLYCLDSGAVTLAAASTTKGAAGTITLINGFVNPATSTKTCSILRAIITTVSGTPAGGFFWNYLNLGAATVTSATTGTVLPTRVGSSSGSPVLPAVNVILTLSAGTPSFVQLGSIGGPTAVAASGSETTVEEINGLIQVPPNTVFGIAGTGVGTTHIVQSTIYWEEL